MFRRKQSQHERATEYATCKDFQQIFKEDMAGLHLLAYLLTADKTKAEQCFVAGLEDSIHGNLVFKQWARTWSKRAIIQNAIKTVAPAVAQGAAVQENAAFELQNGNGSESPLVSLVIVTVAPGTTLPSGSTTDPKIEPDVVCAATSAASSNAKSAANLRCLMPPPHPS